MTADNPRQDPLYTNGNIGFNRNPVRQSTVKLASEGVVSRAFYTLTEMFDSPKVLDYPSLSTISG
jgi:hypothetical protein